MTASDHLGRQFMHIADVGRLKSANDWGMTLAESYSARYSPRNPRQAGIDQSMARDGWHEDKPLTVANGNTGHDGHHRYYAARAAGNIAMIPVQHVQFSTPAANPATRATQMTGMEDGLRSMAEGL